MKAKIIIWTWPGRKVRRDGRGFALVVCLSCMVLLVVLVVGLMSLSTVALRGSGRELAMAEARANARLGLVMALGELQEELGRDRRVTVQANLAGTLEGDELAAGAEPANLKIPGVDRPREVTKVRSGSRYWTAVWENPSETPERDLYTKAPTPKLVKWLVSGNEGVKAAEMRTPAEEVWSATGDDVVSLVEKGSVGDREDLRVRVPKVNLADGQEKRGGYGWWVGDLGAAASMRPAKPVAEDTEVGEAGAALDRMGVEALEGLEYFPRPGQGRVEDLAKLQTVRTAEVMEGATRGDERVQALFHAVGVGSMGVMSDALRGGLRRDLGVDLGSGWSMSGGGPGIPGPGQPIIPKEFAPQMLGPKWDLVKSHLQLAGEELEVREPSDVRAGVVPVVAELRLLFGAKLVEVPANGTYQIHPCAKVAIALANPYPVPMRWTQPLDLVFLSDSPAGNLPSRIWGAAGQPAYLSRSDANEPAVLNQVTFRIAADVLPPGECRAYTQSGQVVRPASSVSAVTIPLVEFTSTDAPNFNSCVLLQHMSENAKSTALSLDVRESWTTSSLTAELRMGSRRIRRVERFELDDGFFSGAARRITATEVTTMKQPFPLHLFSFQLSRPGQDYASLFSSAGLMGSRGSTLRTYMDFNIRGQRNFKNIACYNPPPYFMETTESFASLPFSPPGGECGLGFTRNLAMTPVAWGESSFGPEATILFGLPTRLGSIADMQHMDLTADDIDVSIVHQPAYAVGNSYATPFVERSKAVQKRKDYTVIGSPNPSGVTPVDRNYYDLSYLLNVSLWDRYFVSPRSENGEFAEDGPAVVIGPQEWVEDGQKAAAAVMLASFNVNSLSKEAWKALFLGTKYRRHPKGSGDEALAMHARSLDQTGSALERPTGKQEDSYSGYRRLTDEQADALAEEMVRQVRKRGPFLSLGQFVNRTLVEASKDAEAGRYGPLQAAIDGSYLNVAPAAEKGKGKGFSEVDEANDRVRIPVKSGAPIADLDGGDATVYASYESNPVWAVSSRDDNPGTVGSIYADAAFITNTSMTKEQGYRSTGIPGWLTQADMLQAIGPVLSVRSDTFRVRAYGESVEAGTGKVVARAWCEAVVQRLPDWVDSRQLPWEEEANLSEVNRRFGRRMEVVSFRWLSQDEI